MLRKVMMKGAPRGALAVLFAAAIITIIVAVIPITTAAAEAQGPPKLGDLMAEIEEVGEELDDVDEFMGTPEEQAFAAKRHKEAAQKGDGGGGTSDDGAGVPQQEPESRHKHGWNVNPDALKDIASSGSVDGGTKQGKDEKEKGKREARRSISNDDEDEEQSAQHPHHHHHRGHVRKHDGVDGEEEGAFTIRYRQKYGTFGRKVPEKVWDGRHHAPTVDDHIRDTHRKNRLQEARRGSARRRGEQRQEELRRLHRLQKERNDNYGRGGDADAGIDRDLTDV